MKTPGTVAMKTKVAFMQFNDGALAITKVLEEMSCYAGVHTVDELQAENDKPRKRQRKESAEVKRQRKLEEGREKVGKCMLGLKMEKNLELEHFEGFLVIFAVHSWFTLYILVY